MHALTSRVMSTSPRRFFWSVYDAESGRRRRLPLDVQEAAAWGGGGGGGGGWGCGGGGGGGGCASSTQPRNYSTQPTLISSNYTSAGLT